VQVANTTACDPSQNGNVTDQSPAAGAQVNLPGDRHDHRLQLAAAHHHYHHDHDLAGQETSWPRKFASRVGPDGVRIDSDGNWDSLNHQLPVPQSHHDAVARPRGDLEHVGHRPGFDDQGVVAGRDERIG